MNLLFHALAHPARRKILDLVRDMPGCCLNDLCKYFEVSRIAIIKHLRLLEETQLLLVQKQGRKLELYFNVVPIQLIYDRWTTQYSSFWASKAVDLKFQIESSMSRKSPAKPRVQKRQPGGKK